MRNRYSGIITGVLILVMFGGFGFMIYDNAQPAEPLRVIIPTQPEPTNNPDTLSQIFSEGFGDDSTPLPTVAIPTERFIPPTIPAQAEAGAGAPIRPGDLGPQESTLAPVSVGATPTPPPPTSTLVSAVDAGESVPVVQNPVQRATQEWQPPSLPVPQSRDALGRDHYIFRRPVDSNANNYGLFYYPYGASGQQILSISSVHHGIDFSNPEGTPIRSVADGTVVFASEDQDDIYPGSPSYGVVIVIEHDYVWDGQVLWTLYAHLDQAIVREGQRVSTGDIIALSGNSGRSSGPHLHFEVRMGLEAPLAFGDTYNPVLWIVPYVGHGTVAGRLVDAIGNDVEGVIITLRSTTTGKVYTTTTYTFDGTINEINRDPKWQENFVIGDVPQGRYVILTDYNGQRISDVIDVFEGVTTFVEMEPVQIATPIPADDG